MQTYYFKFINKNLQNAVFRLLGQNIFAKLLLAFLGFFGAQTLRASAKFGFNCRNISVIVHNATLAYLDNA